MSTTPQPEPVDEPATENVPPADADQPDEDAWTPVDITEEDNDGQRG